MPITKWSRTRIRERAEARHEPVYETDGFLAVGKPYLSAPEVFTDADAGAAAGGSGAAGAAAGTGGIGTSGADGSGAADGAGPDTEPDAGSEAGPDTGPDLSDLPDPIAWHGETQFPEMPEYPDDADLDYDDIFNDDPEAVRRKKTRRRVRFILREIFLFILIFAVSVLAVASYNIYVQRQNVVYGTSMEPTLHEGEHVYTSLLPYVFGEPEIGDIVVIDISMLNRKVTYFHLLADVLRNNRISSFLRGGAATETDTCWIKRVVGVAGDTIEFRGQQFYRNGEPVEETYLLDQNNNNYPQNWEPLVVPEGCVFVMGDNRRVSRDSRVIGCIPVTALIGKFRKKA